MSVATVLFGRRGRGAAAVTARVAGLAGPAQLSRAAMPFVAAQVTSVATGLLDPDLGQLAVAAWRTHDALRRAARETLDAPETRQLVELGRHRIGSVHRPYVDLLMDGVVVQRIEFTLTLDVTVASAVGVVVRGRLMSVECGRPELTAALAIAGAEVIKRSGRVDLRMTIALGSAGVPILAEERVALPGDPG